MKYPSFEEFAEVVRNYTSMKRDRPLYPKTELQRDLALNEDECTALFRRLETFYGITLSPESLDLKKDQPLFHSEDAAEDAYIQTVFGNAASEIRPLTLGQLCRATLKELSRH
jgi:hypothetical protein